MVTANVMVILHVYRIYNKVYISKGEHFSGQNISNFSNLIFENCLSAQKKSLSFLKLKIKLLI